MFKYISVLIFFLLSSAISAQEGVLEIEISNIKSAEGYMMVALFDSEDTFLGTTYFRATREEVAAKGAMTLTIKDLPFGKYAISIFHDENNNQDLDTNKVGIPKEPYGFSNNARGFFGPPNFDSAAFDHQQSNQKIAIRLR